MVDIDLTQKVAGELVSMEKHRIDDTIYRFPRGGEGLSVQLVSADKREEFFLDLRRGRIDLNKVTYQNRARKIVVLIRIDLEGPPHRNPDGTELLCPHMHKYQEGFGDKWAYAIPQEHFRNILDLWITLIDFMKYCNITKQPHFQRGL